MQLAWTVAEKNLGSIPDMNICVKKTKWSLRTLEQGLNLHLGAFLT